MLLSKHPVDVIFEVSTIALTVLTLLVVVSSI
jgi:hypothetical protein